jgi:hypothetical protein
MECPHAGKSAQMMGTDASHLSKAMKDWWQFKNFELNNK